MTRASSSLRWFLKIEDIFIIRENVCASVLENLYLEGVFGLLGVHSLLVGTPVGEQLVTLPVRTLATAQHTGSYSVTLSADGANGVPVYREKEFSNTKQSTSITFTSANATSSDPVSVSFYGATYNNTNGLGIVRYSRYVAGYMELSVPDGYAITGINFTFTSGARDLTASTGTFSRNGNNVTWTSGASPTTTVRFSSTSSSTAYLKTINIEYVAVN